MIEEDLEEHSTHHRQDGPPLTMMKTEERRIHGSSGVSEEWSPSWSEELKAVLWDGPLNILLLAFPIAWTSYLASGPDLLTFIFSLLALAPLAERLGFVTEQLAFHTNDTIGGLLNATFGNATELIISIAALQKGLFKLVQLSLLGSVLSNMLLVLGCSFFFGGLRHKEQRYSKLPAQMNSTLLLMASAAILYPTALTLSNSESNSGELSLSRMSSVILLAAYVGLIYFQLVSHKHLYDVVGDSDIFTHNSNHHVAQNYTVLSKTEDGGEDEEMTTITLGESLHGSKVGSTIGFGNNKSDDLEGKQNSVQISTIIEKEAAQDEDEGPVMRYQNAVVWLVIITILIAILSKCLSDTIENAADSAGVSGVFISAILLPIVGNAAEHAGAVMFAMKGKLDLSLGVAIGSSTQIALCVLPLLVILGWMMDKDMTMNFGAYEAITMLMSVIAVAMAVKDGTSNYLLGLILIGSYIVIAIGFIVHHNEPLS